MSVEALSKRLGRQGNTGDDRRTHTGSGRHSERDQIRYDKRGV